MNKTMYYLHNNPEELLNCIILNHGDTDFAAIKKYIKEFEEFYNGVKIYEVTVNIKEVK